jgi:hypothetical protein
MGRYPHGYAHIRGAGHADDYDPPGAQHGAPGG